MIGRRYEKVNWVALYLNFIEAMINKYYLTGKIIYLENITWAVKKIKAYRGDK